MAKLFKLTQLMVSEESEKNEKLPEFHTAEFSEYVKIMKSIRVEIEKATIKYAQYIDLHLKDALIPETLAYRQSRDLYKAKVNKATYETEKTKKQIYKVFNKYELALLNFQLPTEADNDSIQVFNKSFIKGANQGMQKGRDYLDSFFAIQSEVLQTIQDIYLLLDSCDEHFVVINDQIMFDDMTAMNTYNQYTQNIIDLDHKFEQNEKKYIERLKTSMQELETILD